MRCIFTSFLRYSRRNAVGYKCEYDTTSYRCICRAICLNVYSDFPVANEDKYSDEMSFGRGCGKIEIKESEIAYLRSVCVVVYLKVTLIKSELK